MNTKTNQMSKLFMNMLCVLALLAFYPSGGAGFAASAATHSPDGDSGREISIDLQVYFPQNVIVLEPGYKDNELRLSEFVRRINQAMADSTYRVQDIVIRSAASPEGPYDHNVWLSENRGLALKSALQARLSIPDSCFVMDAVGEDWEGLRDMVRLYDTPRKQEVLGILDRYFTDTTPQPRRSELCKLELGKLDRGKVWDHLYGNIFPYLRNASNSVVCHLVPVTRVTVVREQEAPAGRDTLFIVSSSPCQDAAVAATAAGAAGAGAGAGNRPASRVKKPWEYRFAVKSNALFDAVLCPNVELEFPIGRRFSLMAEHWFPWYVTGNDKYAYEILYSGAELRYWLGDRADKSVLEGWFVGSYAGATMYDLEYGGKGYQGESWLCGGLSFGRSWKLGKRWRFETSLSVGYVPTDYRYYELNEDVGLLIWQRDGKYSWIGPTKAKASFSYLIGLGRKPRTEGGEK